MAAVPFDLTHAPPVGVPEAMAPGLRVVTAPNAGPMTFTGTRSYILGEGEVAVVDPGPDDPRHLAALAEAVRGERVAAVLVTHSHSDHSAGARSFATRVGACRAGTWRCGGSTLGPDGAPGGDGRARRWRGDRRRLSAGSDDRRGRDCGGAGLDSDRTGDAGTYRRPFGLRLGRGRSPLFRGSGDGLGDTADLAARRRLSRVPREPDAAAATGRDGLLSGPRCSGTRSAGGAHLCPGSPGRAARQRSARRWREGRRGYRRWSRRSIPGLTRYSIRRRHGTFSRTLSTSRNAARFGPRDRWKRRCGGRHEGLKLFIAAPRRSIASRKSCGT